MHPKSVLARHGLHPKQSLGQNFLLDDNLLAQITALAELSPAESVLEVGPGLGALTHHLAAAAGRVVAVELDDRLLPILAAEFAADEHVTIVHGDILDVQPADWFGDTPYKVVANVPYYITGAILRHLLENERRPQRLVLTVQDEVARRLTAVPPQMSLLAASVQYYGRVTRALPLKAGAFWPRPGVDSAAVVIAVHDQLPLPSTEERSFFTLLRTGFAQKRKQLQKNLRALGHDRDFIATALESVGVDGRRRAETLTIPEWVALFHALKGTG